MCWKVPGGEATFGRWKGVVSGYFQGNSGFETDQARAEPHIRRLLEIYRREMYGVRVDPAEISKLEGYLRDIEQWSGNAG